MITKTCPRCNISFDYEPVVGFPDKRLYCNTCKVRKKAEWDAKQNGTVPVNPLLNGLPTKVPATGNEVTPENGNFQSTVWNHQVRPHSSEMGPAGNRHKIYWETVEELKAEIQELRDAGLMDLPLDKLPRD